MSLGRTALRLLAILLVAALPPLVAFTAALAVADAWVTTNGYGTALLVGGGVTVIWVTIVAVVAQRLVADEARSMLELAQRGISTGGEGGLTDADEGLTDVQRRLAATLDERNRQISTLASHMREAPVSEDAPAVARSLVAAARSMTGDPTWTLAVLRDTTEGELPAGVYTTDEGVLPLEDVHGWASTVDLETRVSRRAARYLAGPWGAFVIIGIAVRDDLRAMLVAPREGRQEPSPAELDLLELLGQHAATAIDHALLYARLRRQTDELNRMAALQTDFLRGVTHDLQTPLTSIGAVASELRQVPGLPDPARSDLETITHQADRLRRMVGQLLVVSRLEAGVLTPSQEVFRTEPLLRKVWAALRPERPLELVEEGPAHLVVGDPDRLEQALWAVLDNAVRYSPPKAPITIRLNARERGGGVVGEIAVRDEGAGMDAVTLQRAFDQFYRSADARRLSPDGSGVGLYAARGLARAMGGDIVADSRLGGGTTITITLPAELADAPDETEAPSRG